MFGVTGLIILFIIKAKTYAEEDLSNNGWRPLSNEQVFNLNRKLTNTPDIVTTTQHWNPVLLEEENIRHIEQNTKIEPQDINRELTSSTDYTGTNEKQNLLSVPDNITVKKHNYVADETKIMNKPLIEHQRKAKNMIANLKNSDMDILHSRTSSNNIVETDMLENEKMKEAYIINDKSNMYEVTEVSEASEVKDLIDVGQSQIYLKKPYFEPIAKTTTETNLSSILLNILSNYNIRINDDLKNYAVSRKKYNSNNYKQNYGYLTPVRIQPSRNSGNYLPLELFLAVFLSNYGLYLPGYYGFPGNYYNIYGHLASNNIHNNKPFGAYKIYSDTDSFH